MQSEDLLVHFYVIPHSQETEYPIYVVNPARRMSGGHFGNKQLADYAFKLRARTLALRILDELLLRKAIQPSV